MATSIQELAKRCKNDPNHLEELWMKFEPRCRRWAKQVGKVTRECEDLYQEAYEVLWNAVMQYDESKHEAFDKYFFKALSNKGKNYWKRSQNRYKHEVLNLDTDEEGKPYKEQADGTVDLEAALLQEETRYMIERWLKYLKKEEQELLEAFYFKGESREKISLRLGVSCDAIDGRKKRYLAKLKKIIEKSLEKNDGFSVAKLY